MSSREVRKLTTQARSRNFPTDLAQGQPHLQRPEAPRVLWPVFMVIDGGWLFSEVVVGRMVAEGLAQHFWLAHESTTGLQWRVQPLVRVHRDRVGFSDPLK